jgi:hypothetical protein
MGACELCVYFLGHGLHPLLWLELGGKSSCQSDMHRPLTYPISVVWDGYRGIRFDAHTREGEVTWAEDMDEGPQFQEIWTNSKGSWWPVATKYSIPNWEHWKGSVPKGSDRLMTQPWRCRYWMWACASILQAMLIPPGWWEFSPCQETASLWWQLLYLLEKQHEQHHSQRSYLLQISSLLHRNQKVPLATRD